MKTKLIDNRNKLFIMLFAFVLTIIITGCNNIINLHNEKQENKATVCFYLDEPRTIFPNVTISNLTKFELFKVVDSQEIPLFNEPCTSAEIFCRKQIEIEPGEYTFILRAKVSETNFMAQKTVTVVNGLNNISFELQRIDFGIVQNQPCYGRIDINIFIPEDFGITDTYNGILKIMYSDTNAVLGTINGNESYNCLCSTVPEDFEGTEYSVEDFPKKIVLEGSLPVNSYFVSFYLYSYDYRKKYEVKEYLYLATGCCTSKNIFITDVLDMKVMNIELNGGHLADNIDVIAVSEGETIDLTSIIPVKNNNSFEGWFLDDSFNIAAPDTVVVDNSFDSKTFYAKWENLLYFEEILNVPLSGYDIAEFSIEPDYSYEVTLCDSCKRSSYYESNEKCDAKFYVYMGEEILYSEVDDKIFSITTDTSSTVKIKAIGYYSDGSGDCYVSVIKKSLSDNYNITEKQDGSLLINLPVEENYNDYSVSLNGFSVKGNTSFTQDEKTAGVFELEVLNFSEIGDQYKVLVNCSSLFINKDFHFFGTTSYKVNCITYNYQVPEKEDYKEPYSQSQSVIDVIEVPEDTYHYHTFNGWYDNPECNGSAITSIDVTTINENYTLYAKWESLFYKEFPISLHDQQEHYVTFDAEAGYLYEIIFCNKQSHSDYYDSEHKTMAYFSALANEIKIISGTTGGSIEYIARFDSEIKLSAKKGYGDVDGDCCIFVVKTTVPDNLSLTENSDGTFDVSFPLNNNDNFYIMEMQKTVLPMGPATSEERQNKTVRRTITNRFEQGKNYYVEIEYGDHSYYFIGTTQYPGQPDCIITENANGTFTFDVKYLPEDPDILKIWFEDDFDNEEIYEIDVTDEECAAGHKTFTLNSPFPKGANYTIDMDAIKDTYSLLYAYGIYEGTALYETADRQWNDDGTLSLKVKVIEGTEKIKIETREGDRKIDNEYAWTPFYFDVNEEDITAGYKIVTIDSPYAKDSKYWIDVILFDSSETRIKTYYLNGFAQKDGKYALKITLNTDGTVTVHVGFSERCKCLEVLLRDENYCIAVQDIFEITPELASAGYVEYTLDSPFRGGKTNAAEIRFYPEKNAETGSYEYHDVFLTRWPYFYVETDGLDACYVTNNSDGTFTIRAPVKQDTNYIEIRYVEDSASLCTPYKIYVDDNDKATKYKLITLNGIWNKDERYDIWVMLYDEFNSLGEWRLLNGTVSYDGLAVPSITEQSDGSFILNLPVSSDIRTIKAIQQVKDQSDDYLDLGNQYTIEVTDEDIETGYKQFTIPSQYHSGDVYKQNLELYTASSYRIFTFKFEGTAQYEGQDL